MALLGYTNWCRQAPNLPTAVSGCTNLTPVAWAAGTEPLARVWRFQQSSLIAPAIFTLMGGSTFGTHYPVRIVALLLTTLSSTANQATVTITVRESGPGGGVVFSHTSAVNRPALPRKRHLSWLIPPDASGLPRWVNHIQVEVTTTDGGPVEIGMGWTGPAIELRNAIPTFEWIDPSRVEETYSVRDVPVIYPIRQGYKVEARRVHEQRVYPGEPPIANPLGGPQVLLSPNAWEQFLYDTDRRMLWVPFEDDGYRDRGMDLVRITGPLRVQHSAGGLVNLSFAAQEE